MNQRLSTNLWFVSKATSHFKCFVLKKTADWRRPILNYFYSYIYFDLLGFLIFAIFQYENLIRGHTLVRHNEKLLKTVHLTEGFNKNWWFTSLPFFSYLFSTGVLTSEGSLLLHNRYSLECLYYVLSSLCVCISIWYITIKLQIWSPVFTPTIFVCNYSPFDFCF